jgi:hypothetical protein
MADGHEVFTTNTSGFVFTSGSNANFELAGAATHLQPLLGYDPFSGQSQDSRITELLLENQELRAEVERLRKQIGKNEAIKDLRRIEKELR